MNFTEEQKRAAWNNAFAPVEGYDKNQYRLDSCDALIYWKSYGEDTNMGWEVDHVFPKEKGGDENPINLRAMQHQNNSSKGDDYPTYNCAVEYSARNRRNEPCNKRRTVNAPLRAKLAKLYGPKAS